MASSLTGIAGLQRCLHDAKVASCRVYFSRPYKRILQNVKGKNTARCAYQTDSAVASTPIEPPSPEQYRYYPEFSVYKSRGSMKVVVLSPTWRTTSPNSPSCILDRAGSMMLEFAESIGSGSGPGERRYDWEKKLTFAMSAYELGIFADPDPLKAIKPLFHDPNMGRSNAGSMSKSLSIEAGTEGSWFISLKVRKNGENRKIGVSLDRAEFATFREITKYLIPHLMGFDMAVGGANFKPPSGGTA